MLSSADDKAAEASKGQDIFLVFFKKRIGLFSPSQSGTYLQALHSQKSLTFCCSKCRLSS